MVSTRVEAVRECAVFGSVAVSFGVLLEAEEDDGAFNLVGNIHQ